MVTYAGQGDPVRTMALLWGGPADAGSKPGPRPALTLDAVVAAAIGIADADGLAEVSMRTVGARLGKSAMALYTYVPSKAELLDLMVDRLLATADRDLPYDRGWRAAAEASARGGWEFHLRHPWLLHISGTRSVLGPHELDAYEAQLRVFAGLGLAGLDVARLVGMLHTFVRGAAAAMAEARAAERATGISEDDWWTARAGYLEDIAKGPAYRERYPTITSLDQQAAFDVPQSDEPYLEQQARDTFEQGLAVLLDGMERFIATRAADAGKAG
ncbi:TetR family transcriptional regulator [Pilimelia anulata]|uniref:TetR family transcriptional regulator n=1 Tax=Pilimelia anulata TaxID=53371 RepID=A0A8J3B1R4_9ACTN|nr:TetR/AcrR family transcriptional regulator C-terminal domain-containing protein [Pilimelia anulata]GGJ86487.1 TetR family transcriptional regulator [Pilimelia anulata]